jgi:hypothetical protein
MIESFDYLHKQVNVFLHDHANVVWSLKVQEGLPLSILVTYFSQRVSITLQNMQASSILSRMIVIGLAISQLPPLQDSPLIPILNLL